jgi:exopolysaccharide production protein ExoZ
MKRLAYIDALRGYAILMVIAVHSSQYFKNLSPTVAALANQGARGVQLFFVASAMTLTMSWTARHDGVTSFYIRRFFRIAPMFYLCIPFFLYLNGFGPNIYAPDGVGLRHVVMAATFTHGFMPDTITSVVPGSWSIADEMILYALFPLLMAVRVRLNNAAALVIAATLVCMLIEAVAVVFTLHFASPTWLVVWKTFYFLWIFNQFPCFLFGILVARCIEDGRMVLAAPLLVVTSIALALIGPFALPLRAGVLLPILYGLIFAMFALGLSNWQPKILVNPIICWIGKISYSAYLIHLALIAMGSPFPHETYSTAFITLSALTIAISSLTYLFIERPFIRIGHAIALRRSTRGLELSGRAKE